MNIYFINVQPIILSFLKPIIYCKQIIKAFLTIVFVTIKLKLSYDYKTTLFLQYHFLIYIYYLFSSIFKKFFDLIFLKPVK